MKNKIEDLRNHLFATLEALSDKADPMPIDRAKAIAEVGQVIVNSAKVECEFIKATGQDKGTGFIDPKPQVPALPSAPGMPVPRLVHGRDTR
jgi:hypothetical protein